MGHNTASDGAVLSAVSSCCVQAVATGCPAPLPLPKVNALPPLVPHPCHRQFPQGDPIGLFAWEPPQSEAPPIPELREKPPVYEKLSCPVIGHGLMAGNIAC